MDIEIPIQTNQVQPTGMWDQVFSKNSSCFPLKRVKQTGLLYKGMLYVFGGLFENLDGRAIHRHQVYNFNFITNQWSEIVTTVSGVTALNISYGHSAVVNSSIMYVFGGVNFQGEYTNEFLGLNLDSLHWKRIEQKGDLSPPPRQSSNLLVYKGAIILYGGKNQSGFLHDFHFYKLDSKMWFIAQLAHYQEILRVRYRPGMCVNEQYLYIFGGESIKSVISPGIASQNIDIESVQYLDDFYRLELNFRATVVKPQVKVLKVITPQNPGFRSGHALMSISNKKYLILIGGDNNCLETTESAKHNNEVWVFDTIALFWICVKANGYEYVSRVLFSCFEYENEVLTFGGVDSKNKILDEVCRLTFNYNAIQAQIERKSILEICKECHETQQKFLPMKTQLPSQLLDKAIARLDFPFSAFGLLVDNATMLSPKTCSIVYSHTHREKYCLIRDDGTTKLWENNEEFISSMLRWQGVAYDYQESQEKDQNTEKIPKARNAESKEQKAEEKREKRVKKSNQLQAVTRQRKIYAWNLKIGALRLGSSFFYLQRDQKNKRAVYYKKFRSGSGQEKYIVYYYILHDGKYTDPAMAPARKLIDQQLKVPNRIIGESHKSISTFVFILDWHQTQGENGELEPQIVTDYHQNDVIYGDRKRIQKMASIGMLAYECCDISLKTYLSLLYLKDRNLNIFFGVRDSKLQSIPNQNFLDRIDKAVKAKHILDITDAFDEVCNIIEILYDPDPRKKTNLFHNGVLFYHQNRLIDRYRYRLGTFVQRKAGKLTGSQNFVSIFGYVELPDSYPVNSLKNSFLMDQYLEKIYSRIKLVEKVMAVKTASCRLGSPGFGKIRAIKKKQKDLKEKDVSQEHSMSPERFKRIN